MFQSWGKIFHVTILRLYPIFNSICPDKAKLVTTEQSPTEFWFTSKPDTSSPILMTGLFKFLGNKISWSFKSYSSFFLRFWKRWESIWIFIQLFLNNIYKPILNNPRLYFNSIKYRASINNKSFFITKIILQPTPLIIFCINKHIFI